jgi:Holliday junction resolvasome RuvABC endonuclease subunit
MIVLGVDPAVTHVAFGDDDGRTAIVRMPTDDRGGARLAQIHLATRKGCRKFVRGKRPRMCCVESPAGHVHPSLWQAFGVIQAAIFMELAAKGEPVNVMSLGPTEWKKLVLHDGQASKADIMEWAVAHRFDGSTQDEADAYAIATAGAYILDPPSSAVGL